MQPEVLQASPTNNQTKWLYDKYSAPLLGYINGIVQNQQLSETYLITILSRFAYQQLQSNSLSDTNWVKLMQFSRNLLLELVGPDQFHRSIASSGQDLHSNNGLTPAEHYVFHSIYHHGKTIAALAIELGEDEIAIRKRFKSAFDKVRRKHGN